MNTWFTADTHFGHKNVIGYCKRPYETVEDMNERMIQIWNETVAPSDYVFHLGDFAFMNKVATAKLIPRLNGLITLVMGNHDKRKPEFYLECGFQCVHKLRYGASVPYWTVESGKTIVAFEMSHYPFQHVMGDYDQRDYLVERAPTKERLAGKVLVHGHVHQAWRLRPNMVNVGVDVWGLKPVSLEELLIRVRFVGNWPDSNSHESVV